MTAESIIGSVAIGKDTSGNFKQSFYGLAVRPTPDGPFFARQEDKLVDVTNLTLDGTENLIYRIPKKTVSNKDIIVRSDNPFSVMFVQEFHKDGSVWGIDPATQSVVHYLPVTNPLGVNFFVTVVGPEKLLEENDDNELMRFAILSNQGTAATTDPLTTIAWMRSLGSKEVDNKAFKMAMFSRLAGGTNDPLAWMVAFQGSDLFEKEKEKPPKIAIEQKRRPNKRAKGKEKRPNNP